jgi:drug/metabolite transporter (DMT)-like permease
MNVMVYAAMRYYYRQDGLIAQLPNLLKPAIGGGVLHCVMVLLQMHALLMIPVPFVVSLKRLSVLFSSLWAFFVRRDRKPSSGRLIGTVLVVLGIALITLAGN